MPRMCQAVPGIIPYATQFNTPGGLHRCPCIPEEESGPGASSVKVTQLKDIKELQSKFHNGKKEAFLFTNVFPTLRAVPNHMTDT